MSSASLLKHRYPGPFEMPWAKWDVPTELADTAQDLRENCDLLESRFDTPGCFK